VRMKPDCGPLLRVSLVVAACREAAF